METIGERRVVEDVDAVRAMANPHRVAILHFLLSGPARTATECAAEVGGTASACSYHLRELERFGLVERVESTDDGRARPWRAAAVGFSIGTGLVEDSPTGRAAEIALTRAELIENQRLIKRFLDARDSLDPEWRSASDFHTYELVVSPTELNDLNTKIGELLRAYRAPTRTDAPDDAGPIRVIYQAFPRLPVSE
ncbi:MAG: winged helix-turn-helix domain-containing protein [Actinomycetota bacterium]